MSKIRNKIWCFVVAVLACACSDITVQDKKTNETSGVSLHTELGGSAVGYERACGPREFSFPLDHGAHPSFRNEWWYVTGNVQNDAMEQFGFHATFFRVANKPDSKVAEVKRSGAGLAVPDQPTEDQPTQDQPTQDQPGQDQGVSQAAASAWETNQFYMAHFAITEARADQVSAHERFSRAGVGLAGAQLAVDTDEKIKVWLDDWSLKAVELDGELEWRLSLAEGDDAIDFTLRAQKPLVLQGDGGFSQKSSDPCNASYYYSISRMQVVGQLRSNGSIHKVAGTAWLDREWSSSALADDQVGWDWFSLQLTDGRDIMIYFLRKNDGSTDESSYAVEIDQQGNTAQIDVANLTIDIKQWWQSPHGGRYPLSGKIVRDDSGEVLVFTPLINDQELNLAVRYWEGAIRLADTSGVSIGHGYMELTGY